MMFPKLQIPIDFPGSVAPVKSLWKSWVYCPEKFVQTLGNQLLVNDFTVKCFGQLILIEFTMDNLVL